MMSGLRLLAAVTQWFIITVLAWLLKGLLNATIAPWLEDILTGWRNKSRSAYERFKGITVDTAKATVEAASQAKDAFEEGVSFA